MFEVDVIPGGRQMPTCAIPVVPPDIVFEKILLRISIFLCVASKTTNAAVRLVLLDAPCMAPERLTVL